MMVQKSNDFCGLPPHEKGHESMETMGSLRRTDYCGELSLADAGARDDRLRFDRPRA